MLRGEELSDLLERIEALHRRQVGEAAASVEGEHLAVLPWRGPSQSLRDALDPVLGFANSKGGHIIIGVEASGEITGVEGGDLQSLIGGLFAQTRPGVLCEGRSQKYKGKTVFLLYVSQSPSVHAGADGRRLRRCGSENLPITPDQDALLMAERQGSDPSDQRVEGCSLEDIDPIQIMYLREILRRTHDQHDLLSLTDQELLRGLGLVTEDGDPKFAALLLLGKRAFLSQKIPQVEVVYTHYDAGEEPDHQEHLLMPLLHTLSRLQDLIEARNRFVTLKQGLFHHKVKDFDDVVYREAMVNALVHRDYTRRDGSVYVNHYADRIELSNPGGFIGGISRDNILYHAPRHRNRRLSEALQQLGLMERGGHGVNRLYRYLLRRGKEAPQYEDTPDSILLILQGGAIDENFAAFVAGEEQSGKVLTLDQLILLSHLKVQRTVDVSTAAKLCQRPSRAVGASLAKMVDLGYLERIGANRGTTGYRLSARLYKVFNKPMSYFRDRGLDAKRQQALIMEVVDELGEVSLDDVQELCATDLAGARSLLRGLVQKGTLKKHKDANGAWIYGATTPESS